jgi:ABC-type Fe3+/spermidine/putrescine transport system ATPase subunit
MALLSVSGLYKVFDGVPAVNGVSFSADPGEILCLLGPSGCGKTTLLRMLAGLEEPDAGAISFEERSIINLAPQQRGFGLMFQDLALFPHMDVFGNVAFGLRMQKLPAARVQARVQELLELVEMGEYTRRKVHELSGGERQRVALARSLAPAPRLLMLDEPLGSLDRALRESLQRQIRGILKEVGVTSIYVTHDRDEAFTMADRLIFMNRGSIVQMGTPEEVVANPADGFVARTLGFKNVFRGVVLDDGEILKIECSVGVLTVAKPPGLETSKGSDLMILVNENGISMSALPLDEAAPGDSLQGVITERVFRGDRYELRVQVGKGELYCHASADAVPNSVRFNDGVTLNIDPKSIRFLGGGD